MTERATWTFRNERKLKIEEATQSIQRRTTKAKYEHNGTAK